LAQMMVGSSVLGVVFTVAGLWISYAFDLTSGASIIMVAGLFFFLNLMVEQAITGRRKLAASRSRNENIAVDPQRS
jgi:zinc transport system permease protein